MITSGNVSFFFEWDQTLIIWRGNGGIYLKGKEGFRLSGIDIICNIYVVISDNPYWTFAI